VFRRSNRNVLTTALASLIVAAAVMPVAPEPVEARDSGTFVDIVNRYRADVPIPPVRLRAVVDEVAAERGRQLAAARELGHDFDYLIRRFDEEGICWRALGEIVAWNTASEPERLERFVSQWYNSDPHRAIMLGPDYTHAGGSWKTGSDGRHYAVMVFVKICDATPLPATYGGFTDIADSRVRQAIVWVTQRGIMNGCSATRFCPTNTLTRGQLAGALANGLELVATNRDYFADDNGHRYEDAINRLRAAGLTSGCGDGNYCPDRGVRRGRLAEALDRVLALRATRTDYFRDDRGTRYEGAINRVAAAGIIGGCGDGRFCPDRRVHRAQAAAILRDAFN
jgi:uncharacterized protein YkwD